MTSTCGMFGIANKFGKWRKHSVREHFSHLRKKHDANAIVSINKIVKIKA